MKYFVLLVRGKAFRQLPRKIGLEYCMERVSSLSEVLDGLLYVLVGSDVAICIKWME